MATTKNKSDIFWLGASLVLIVVGIFFIGSGIWGIVSRNNSGIIALNQPTPTITVATITPTPQPSTRPGRIDQGAVTQRGSSETEVGVGKANQTAQFIEQTGKWVATDYKSGEINKGEYVVRKGDTLWEIAEAVYGNGKHWTKIKDANKSKIRRLKNGQQALIVPGQVLKIP